MLVMTVVVVTVPHGQESTALWVLFVGQALVGAVAFVPWATVVGVAVAAGP